MNVTTFSPIKSTNDLVLAAIKVSKNAPVVNVRQPLHVFYVVDKSGSMSNTLGGLMDDVANQVDQLQVGDAITLVWFSSAGEYGAPIKCYRIVDQASKDELKLLLNEHKRALNLTCFSDPLLEVEKILDETAVFGWKTCLTFFSDGWANDRSVSEEHRKTREIMQRLNGRIDLVLTVAYSDYADQTFLAEMAQLAGGEPVSSSSLHDVSKIYHRFLRRAETSAPRIQINLENLKPEFVFALDENIDTGGITNYQPNENNEIFFVPNASKSDEYLYLIFRNGNADAIKTGRPGNIQNLLKTDRALFENNHVVSAAFASAVVLSQNGKQDEAIEVLGYLGDKHLVEKVGQSFTPTERANAENEIRLAILNRALRWFKGVDFGCVPKRDAFCLLNLLNLLAADESAKFHPRHPDFRYKKIGRGETQVEGYPMFIPDPDASSEFSDLVLNKEFLNLSVRIKLNGTVELPDEITVATVKGKERLDPAGSVVLKRPASLDKIFKCHIYKTYTIVRDANLNVTKLPITCSEELALKLQELGVWVWSENNSLNGKPFSTLQLDKIPVINQLVASYVPTAKELAEKAALDEVIKARLTVLNALRKELDPHKLIGKRNDWTRDEQRFLFALGFSDTGGYNPRSEPKAATDYYEANVFKTSLSGFSNIPSFKEMQEKYIAMLAGEAKLTTAMIPMADEFEDFTEQTSRHPTEYKIKILDERISDLKQRQRELREQIQLPKFAMALAHKWFTDVPPTSDEIKVDITPLFHGVKSQTVTIQFTKKKVYI